MFKKDIRRCDRLIYKLYRMNAHIKPVETHSNFQKGRINLHNCLYKLEKMGWGIIHRKDLDNGDILFSIELTLAGVEVVKARRRHTIHTVLIVLTLVVSILALVFC